MGEVTQVDGIISHRAPLATARLHIDGEMDGPKIVPEGNGPWLKE
jgi:hypothetical protein